jgi:hypothetical protein
VEGGGKWIGIFFCWVVGYGWIALSNRLAYAFLLFFVFLFRIATVFALGWSGTRALPWFILLFSYPPLFSFQDNGSDQMFYGCFYPVATWVG